MNSFLISLALSTFSPPAPVCDDSFFYLLQQVNDHQVALRDGAINEVNGGAYVRFMETIQKNPASVNCVTAEGFALMADAFDTAVHYCPLVDSANLLMDNGSNPNVTDHAFSQSALTFAVKSYGQVWGSTEFDVSRDLCQREIPREQFKNTIKRMIQLGAQVDKDTKKEAEEYHVSRDFNF